MDYHTISFPVKTMNWHLLHKHKRKVLDLYNVAVDKKNLEEIEALETCLAVLEKLLECAPYNAENV